MVKFVVKESKGVGICGVFESLYVTVQLLKLILMTRSLGFRECDKNLKLQFYDAKPHKFTENKK